MQRDEITKRLSVAIVEEWRVGVSLLEAIERAGLCIIPAESALAAERKRVGELEKAGRAVFEYFFGSIVCRPSRDPDMEYELLSELRAALATKEIDPTPRPPEA